MLSGPSDGEGWLRWGGVLVLDDGSPRVVEAGDSARRTGRASPRLTAAAA